MPEQHYVYSFQASSNLSFGDKRLPGLDRPRHLSSSVLFPPNRDLGAMSEVTDGSGKATSTAVWHDYNIMGPNAGGNDEDEEAEGFKGGEKYGNNEARKLK